MAILTMTSRDRHNNKPNALVRNWDLWASLILTALFCGASLWNLESFAGVPPSALWTAVAAGTALGGLVFVTMRWIDDLLNKESEYGEIVRYVDSSGSTMRKPYLLVIWASFATAIYALLMILIYDWLTNPLAEVLILTPLLFLGLYALFGAVSLVRVTTRHSARASRIRAIKEDIARRNREL